ncbi:MAG: M14 family metallopeptidase [Bacteriovoracaceae bacterium]|nr:M14 family metallopeptidase [Bacteriovoracaceae bacterium]
MKLSILDYIPLDLIDCEITQINKVLEGPTLIHIEGDIPNPLFVTTLLHGNETTSFYVLQKLLNDYKDKRPPRDLIIFVGNIEATSLGKRVASDDVDFNRVWCKGDTKYHQVTNDVIEYLKNKNLFASIDIHNNTGANPFYGCINVRSGKFYHLAALFQKKVVYFTEPDGVNSLCFSKICPSITIEAGKSGFPEATVAVYNYVKKVLHLDELRDDYGCDEITLYHTVATIKVNKNRDITVSDEDKELKINPAIEKFNFVPMLKGQLIAKSMNKNDLCVISDEGDDVTSNYLIYHDDCYRVKEMFIPSMLTTNIEVMKKDCLGYVMEKLI